jgi:hypothetical protein
MPEENIVVSSGGQTAAPPDGEYTAKDDKYTAKDDKYTVKEDKYTVKDDKYTVKDDNYTTKDDTYAAKYPAKDAGVEETIGEVSRYICRSRWNLILNLILFFVNNFMFRSKETSPR